MDYYQLIEDNLAKFCIKKTPLSEAINYSLLNKGKRFRGILCYTTTQTFGGNINFANSSSCALEMIHSYSLIHDDLPVMDNDDIRHGKPSNHKKFNQATAILAGDGLQTLAFKIIAEDKNLTNKIKIKLLKVLINASFEMVLGQKLDIDITSKINLEELKNINQLKTGALLKASILMGGIIAQIDDKNMILLEDLAVNLGLAYQIQDDTFDDNNTTKTDNNHNAKKITFVDLLGMQASTKYYQKLYDNALVILEKINNNQGLKELILAIKNREF